MLRKSFRNSRKLHEKITGLMNNSERNPSTPLFPVPNSPSVPERLSRLSGSVKMADCRRVPLTLLVMCVFSLAHQVRGGENNGVGRHGAVGDNPANHAAGPGPGANQGTAERNQAVGASLSRRPSTGWKLSDEAVCREDLTRRCPKHSWNNNLAVLECLQDKKEVN